MTPEYKAYQEQVLSNCSKFAEVLIGILVTVFIMSKLLQTFVSVEPVLVAGILIIPGPLIVWRSEN